MSWYLTCWKKYVDFSGRARRREYWWFWLINSIIASVLWMIAFFTINDSGSSPIFWILYLFALAIVLPSLAVQIRRLHDVGKSGWWIFISLVPFIGSLWLLVLMLSDSQTGTNQYGPNPKEAPAVPTTV
jgi:uncharacterized membrane protein YhaH (DUF805 family)